MTNGFKKSVLFVLAATSVGLLSACSRQVADVEGIADSGDALGHDATGGCCNGDVSDGGSEQGRDDTASEDVYDWSADGGFDGSGLDGGGDTAIVQHKAIAVAAGRSVTCAITTENKLKCWGYNVDGELGDGTRENRSVPVDVIGLDGRVLAVSFGTGTCAIVEGKVSCWGTEINNWENITGPRYVGGPNNVASVSVSNMGNFACLLTEDQEVMCWGDNSRGQLGDGTTKDSGAPVKASVVAEKALAVMANHLYEACALLANGRLQCWGESDWMTPAGTRYKAVSSDGNGEHFCLIREDSGLECVGSNSDGQLGDGTRNDSLEQPVKVIGLQSGVTQVSAGGMHTCAVTDNGDLFCWGDNGYHQARDDTLGTEDLLTPGKIEPIGQVKQVSAGGAHTCAIVNDGDVMCWGDNRSGELGLGWTNPFMFCCGERNLVIGFGGTIPGP